jgi:uncharacterized protein (UPF0548 family)
MILFRTPTQADIARFLARQPEQALTYREVGATANTPPRGYNVDHKRQVLGQGEAAFVAACAALRRWQQFQLGWLTAAPVETPHEVGQVVAVIAWLGVSRGIGVAWLNACRIVYVIGDDGPIHRYGFAYGTLSDHAECGEERFLIEWNRATDEVTYDILAFSRPRHVLARLGYPAVRMLQRKFARDSVKAMQRM